MPVIDSSMYLIPAEDTCLVVDPCISEEAEKLLGTVHAKRCLVLLTHEHYDHISGVNRLRELLPCQVVCSEKCAERIQNPRKNGAAYFEALAVRRDQDVRKTLEKLLVRDYSCQADQTYSGQTEICWEDLTLTLREAPGHSPGSQMIGIKNSWYFTGDSLIPGVRVITRFPGGSREEYAKTTLPYLRTIVPGSILFPGHGTEAVFSGELEMQQ